MRLQLAVTAVFAIALPMPAMAQVNAGNSKANALVPFTVTPVATFDAPWAITFLPDGRLLVNEKPGRMFIVTQRGAKTAVGGVPKVAASGQLGLHDIAIAPDFKTSRAVFLTFAEPGSGGSGLALARARLVENGPSARLDGLQVIWRQTPKGKGGHPGGIIAFAPDGRSLFLTSGDRQRFTPAQDPEQALGKVLRLNLDGTAFAGNPQAKAGGVRAQTWSLGHRNPLGIAFAPDGQLWEIEMGPKGGDELNRILPGKNYGWPTVSYGINYDGSPIPQHPARPEFQQPAIYWNPVIAPAGLAFYTGRLFPAWRGSAFIGGLSSEALIRVSFDGQGGAREADRFAMGKRIRDVAAGPDGALWVIEDEEGGRLLRLTPR